MKIPPIVLSPKMKSYLVYLGEVHGYTNLYVVDGSNVPVNLGVNSSLTNTAIAEYIISQMPVKFEKGGDLIKEQS